LNPIFVYIEVVVQPKNFTRRYYFSDKEGIFQFLVLDKDHFGVRRKIYKVHFGRVCFGLAFLKNRLLHKLFFLLSPGMKERPTDIQK
jgi:hypothetical protein